MAQQDVQLIQQAFQNAMAYRQNQARMAQDSKAEGDRLQLEKDRQKTQADQFNRQYKLWEKQNDIAEQTSQLNREALSQKVTENILNGVPVAGDQTQPGTLGTAPTAQNPMASSTMIHNIPGIGQIELPTPDEWSKQEAARKKVAMQPEIEARQAEDAARQQAETTRQLQVAAQQHADRLAELAQNNIYETERQKSMLRANAALRDSENQFMLRGRMAEVTGGLSEIPGNVFSHGGNNTSSGTGNITIQAGPGGVPVMSSSPNPDNFVDMKVKQLRDATLNTEDLRKQLPKQAGAIEALAGNMGYTVFSKEQTDRMKDLEAVAKVVPALRELNQIRASNPIMEGVPFTDAKARVKTLEDIVNGGLPAISRALSGVKRFNGWELEAFHNYLVPDRNIVTSGRTSGFSKYNEFVTHDIQDAFNQIMGGASQGQKDMIRQRLGLNGLQTLQTAITSPGAQTGTPAGMTPALPLNSGKQARPGEDVHWVRQNGQLVLMGGGQ